MVKEKYGFRIGEKVLFTYSGGKTAVFTIESFDPHPTNTCHSVKFTSGSWDMVCRISKILPCDGSQLLFGFMGG